MDTCCLGLHDKNMRCEVITIQNYCHALVSCQIFLLTDHAVGTEITAFGKFGGDFLYLEGAVAFFFLMLWQYNKLTSWSPCQHCSEPKYRATEYCNGKGKDHFIDA